MLWLPQKGPLLVEHNYGNVGANILGIDCFTGAAAATKGGAVQMVASTAFDAYLLFVSAAGYGVSATTSRGCLDILVGAATEEVLIANLLFGFCGDTAVSDPGPKTWLFPLYIPAGTRIAARVAGDRLSTDVTIGIKLYGGNGYPPFQVGQRVVTYGIGTVPAATAVTPGASGAEGAWTQIVATTSEDHFCIVPSLQGPTGDTTLTASAFWMDLGVGAATEEVVAGGGREHSIVFHQSANERMAGPIDPLPVFANIPSGSRLTARLSRSSAADTVATMDVALHGVS